MEFMCMCVRVYIFLFEYILECTKRIVAANIQSARNCNEFATCWRRKVCYILCISFDPQLYCNYFPHSLLSPLHLNSVNIIKTSLHDFHCSLGVIMCALRRLCQYSERESKRALNFLWATINASGLGHWQTLVQLVEHLTHKTKTSCGMILRGTRFCFIRAASLFQHLFNDPRSSKERFSVLYSNYLYHPLHSGRRNKPVEKSFAIGFWP